MKQGVASFVMLIDVTVYPSYVVEQLYLTCVGLSEKSRHLNWVGKKHFCGIYLPKSKTPK